MGRAFENKPRCCRGRVSHISANELVHVLPHQPLASRDKSPCIIAYDDELIFATGCLPAACPSNRHSIMADSEDGVITECHGA